MKLKFGAIVTDGRGKIGGHVASKNRGGAYLRTKVTPSNPQTAYQSAVRASFGAFSQGWSALSQAQRDGWNGAVADWASTDIFGDIKKPTGLNLFVKINSNLAKIGVASVVDVPKKSDLPFAPIVSAVITASTGATVITMEDVAFGTAKVLVSGTAPVSQGTSFVKDKLRNIAHGTPTAGVITLATAYVDKFGSPAVGSKIFISVEVVNESGQASSPQVVQASVV